MISIRNSFRRLFHNESRRRRSKVNSTSAHLRFEHLESRQMLSATLGDLPLAVEDTLTVEGLAIDRSAGPQLPPLPAGLEDRIEHKLWHAVEYIDEAVQSGGLQLAPGSAELADINLANIAVADVTAAGKIRVYANTGRLEDAGFTVFENLGIDIVSNNEFLGITESWVPYDKVDELAALDSVGFVWLPMRGVTRTGIVNSAGDGILNADDARTQFTVNGTAVRIGVISDGVANRASVQGGATPDLPSVTVNPALPGSGNEGTAMLEIIHDLAPGAQLFFSSGISGLVAMVDSIDWLVDQGVDVIVDDLGLFDQHYFSDDVVAQAVAAAIDTGVVFVTAAGNEAQWHYQGQWSLANGVHDFDPTGAVDNLLDVGVVPAGGQIDVILQWSDAEGNSANNYNLGLWNVATSAYITTSTNVQTGTQNPLETIQWTNTTGAAVTVAVVVDDANNPASRELELFVVPRNFALANLADNDRVATNSVFGQGALLDAISVGAINASDPGNDTIANYSNQGTSTIYTNFVSQANTLRNSLDGAGIDAVQTRIGQLGFFRNPFSGTSAAAPHIAAIAALMLEANPHLTPAQTASVLNATAVDIGATGYDNLSGFGRFDALAAVQAMPPQVLNVTISSTVTNTYGTNPPYEFDSVVGSEEQLRTVPVGGANRLAVQFSEDVVIAQGDLDLIGLNRVVTEPSISSFVAPDSTNGYTATWTFAAALPAAQYLLVLSGDIEDLTGNALDGEWTNPGTILSSVTTSVFPSGNGVAGGDFEFVFTMNFADVNRDGDVDITDKNIQSSHFFGTGKTFTQGDGNGDGAVTIVDSNSLNAVFFDNSYNMRNLTILGDYDDDFDLDANDETDFIGFYNTSNSAADLNGDSNVNQADYDAFYELLNFGVELDMLT